MKFNSHLGLVAFVALASSSLASPITPSYDTFGSLPDATFGGTGIPNNAVAIATSQGFTLGITAHPRFDGPPVSNDGAGTFTATPGAGTSPNLSLWNIGLYAKSSPITAGYTLQFLYDFDPGFGTDESVMGRVNLGSFDGAFFQDSWNLGFPFLASTVPGVITPPAYGSFNPGAIGEFSSALLVFDGSGNEVDRVAQNVVTGTSVPDGGATAGLMLAGIGSLALVRRKWASQS